MLTQDGYSNKYAPNECWHKKVIPINMHQMKEGYSNKLTQEWILVIPINMHQMNVDTRRLFQQICTKWMNVDTRRLFQ